uniref:Uncharacterized protein n=1 Tax=Aegilops tauschii subsp. strangulata TaxID=200361 RepID=A0A453QYW0_AEGTS
EFIPFRSTEWTEARSAPSVLSSSHPRFRFRRPRAAPGTAAPTGPEEEMETAPGSRCRRCLEILCAVLLPPLGVYLRHGFCSVSTQDTLTLTLVGEIPVHVSFPPCVHLFRRLIHPMHAAAHSFLPLGAGADAVLDQRAAHHHRLLLLPSLRYSSPRHGLRAELPHLLLCLAPRRIPQLPQ